MKSGNLNFLEPSGPFQASNGTDLPTVGFWLPSWTRCYWLHIMYIIRYVCRPMCVWIYIYIYICSYVVYALVYVQYVCVCIVVFVYMYMCWYVCLSVCTVGVFVCLYEFLFVVVSKRLFILTTKTAPSIILSCVMLYCHNECGLNFSVCNDAVYPAVCPVTVHRCVLFALIK